MPKHKNLSDSESASDSGPEDRTPVGKKKKPERKPEKKPEKKAKSSGDGDGDDNMFQLSKMRYATVSEFRGKVMVGIREYYEADGDLKPGKKGISLNLEQWKCLKDHVDAIDEAIERF